MRQNIKALMDLNPKEQTLEACLEIENELLAASRDIELQLGSKDRSNSLTGVRLTDKEYHDWRKKALKAKIHIDQRRREYKNRIAGLKNATATETPVKPPEYLGLLGGTLNTPSLPAQG